jgi:regulator of PEP synthase PpsR (kinase-PPPase family)
MVKRLLLNMVGIIKKLRCLFRIKPYKSKLFGLTIDPKRLQQIRSERRPNSRYAEAQQCQYELSAVETIYKNENIPYLNSTHYSIEEITAKIMSHAGLVRRI